MSLIMGCVAFKCTNAFSLYEYAFAANSASVLYTRIFMYVCVLTLHTQGHVEFTKVTRLSLPLSHAAEQAELAPSGIHLLHTIYTCTCTCTGMYMYICMYLTANT